MLEYLALLCTSVYYCLSPLMAENAPGFPLSTRSVDLLFSLVQSKRCISLFSQVMFLWPASVSTAVEGCYKFVLPCWSRVGKVSTCFFFLFCSLFFSFFLFSYVHTVSDMCSIAMSMPKYTMDAPHLPDHLRGPLQAYHSCLIVFFDVYAGIHCDMETGVADPTYVYMCVDCTTCGCGLVPPPADPTERPNTTDIMMATLKLVTWNVRGLRAKPKRLAVLSCLKQMRTVIVETHITGHMQMTLKKPWVGWVYQAPFTNNSRGIAMLIAKTVQFRLHGLRSLCGGGLEVLLLAFYIPPPFQFAALREGVTFMTQHIPQCWPYGWGTSTWL